MKDKIQTELKQAMKSKDKTRLDTLRLLISAIQYEEIQKKVDGISDQESITLVQREIARRKEEIEYAEKANRPEQLEKLKLEIGVLEEFLPKQLSNDELEKIIVDLKKSKPDINMGLAMKALKEDYAGRYDGKAASDIAKRIFS